MNSTGVSNRSCDGACVLYSTMFEITAYFKREEVGASFMPVQRAVVCGMNEKSMTMPTNP